MKKRILSITLALVLILTVMPITQSQASAEIRVIVNGTTVAFDQSPVIENGRTLVPLRAIFEALGATVDWNQSTQTVTAAKDGTTVRLTIGSNIMVVDGRNITLDVPAKIVGGRTLVPARAVAEAFGADVGWDAATRTVLVGSGGTVPTPPQQTTAAVGSTIQFGGYNWRVLDVQGGRALIITEDIIEVRAYHEKNDAVTWETSDMRAYLNGAFLRTFSSQDQARIAETQVSNPDNLWYIRYLSKDTRDRIFLLSLEEVDRYFGDSGDYVNQRRILYRSNFHGEMEGHIHIHGSFFSNAHNSKRIATYKGSEPERQVVVSNWKAGDAWVWWLRSQGVDTNYAAYVNENGAVNVSGVNVYHYRIGGVRPALWLNL